MTAPLSIEVGANAILHHDSPIACGYLPGVSVSDSRIAEVIDVSELGDSTGARVRYTYLVRGKTPGDATIEIRDHRPWLKSNESDHVRTISFTVRS